MVIPTDYWFGSWFLPVMTVILMSRFVLVTVNYVAVPITYEQIAMTVSK